MEKRSRKADKNFRGRLMPDNELPVYVADSQSLIWYLIDSPKLSFNRPFHRGQHQESRKRVIQLSQQRPRLHIH